MSINITVVYDNVVWEPTLTHGIAAKVVSVKNPTEIFKNVYSTGQLGDLEQALVLSGNDRTVAIAGCSHPGVGNMERSNPWLSKY